jgi:hypothetical protein
LYGNSFGLPTTRLIISYPKKYGCPKLDGDAENDGVDRQKYWNRVI